MEEQGLKKFEDRVLRRIFGSRMDEVSGRWRKLHDEELRDLYSSPTIIRIIKLRTSGTWACSMNGEIGYGWEIQREIVH
jgi:hypothetical protein